MIRFKSQAGKNVRRMALQRRIRAIQMFASAGVLLALPFVLYPLFQRLLSLQRGASLGNIQIMMGAACLVGAIAFGFRGAHLWKRANHADQGARAEEDAAQLVEPLRSGGWQIEYGVRDRRVGDVDIFLRSPKGNAYTVDVKSHRGTVFVQDGALLRRFGESQYPFEKDFLRQAKQQAVAMQKQSGATFVTPMILFSNAWLEIPPKPIAGVYVVGKHNVLKCLKSLEQ